jgi:hypothetical protein
MKYLVRIPDALKAELAEAAPPFFGAEDCDALCEIVRSKLARAFPRKTIGVAHVRHEPDLRVPLIRLAVVVDGELDQGLMFRRPPAEAGAAPPVGLAA